MCNWALLHDGGVDGVVNLHVVCFEFLVGDAEPFGVGGLSLYWSLPGSFSCRSTTCAWSLTSDDHSEASYGCDCRFLLRESNKSL
mmetsp:Transcript_45083/g.97935  ORF Transcript_45083/g.97935 Transcript_45083/m.97935 type:complete len:85 (-) Transcript_45083:180-434(-)